MIVTVILLAVIMFLIFDIRSDLLYGKSYYTNKTVILSEFNYFLELLKDANSNAKASVIFPKAQIRFKIIKKQDEKEWWFELQVTKRKGVIF